MNLVLAAGVTRFMSWTFGEVPRWVEGSRPPMRAPINTAGDLQPVSSAAMRILLENDALRADLTRFLCATGVDARVTAEGVELPTLSAETPTEQSRNVHACIAIWKAMKGGVEGVEVRDN